ncbi:MAG: diguanylate cyclase [Candidatus Dactylopiibacterium carminicum]|uniref:Diguanylate cyclase n=1 Tax=Candidatus Dactylopiibacterium carminicum TaxID=857335 RepID=A0A272ETJ8_9RHOO|nr:sensor domain-containing diguanylate cyclase [Candidatus Dactylopiibacterium carminicum]KAF7599366.1 diguanylate cyclase [Candidatus Dactylopiibacterium carminicum]PAS93376.1 MAG: diguanylate cyclase [Candidatus Dactylopiibacterium carminicum]PAS99376.1 MAG: hypothetical protein BSR46_08400 [Candidatus Dactylopiibacterium carminicum]
MSNPHRITLFRALRRTYFGTTLLALTLAALSLATLAFITLRAQQDRNLELIARTIAYTSEASVMFTDSRTAYEILEQIALREHLLEAAIHLPDGREFARYQRSRTDGMGRISVMLVKALPPVQARTEIKLENRLLGEVRIRDSGDFVTAFFFRVVVAGILGLSIVLLAARSFATRVEKRLVSQLDALSSMTHEARIRKDFSQRLPSFEVTEFDQLGKDFNALFDELEERNTELLARQRRLEQANSTLSHLALHDSLTGLANRAYFHEFLDTAIAAAAREHHQIGILYLDNDRFKEINDTHGHAAGDVLLVEVARRLRDTVRDSDLVARLGGDEFAILLAPLHDSVDAERVARKIESAVSAPMQLKPGVIVRPGISVGIAVFPTHAANGEALLRVADQAMYRAKRAKREASDADASPGESS